MTVHSIKKPKILAHPHNFFEQQAWNAGSLVCGIDEAGRGPLAGPVVVACVVLPPHTNYPLLQDSKKLTAKQRNTAYDWITQHCHYTIASASPRDIDTYNIYQATKRTMYQAVNELLNQKNSALVTHVLVDAMPLTITEIHTTNPLQIAYFNYGESISSSVAAASIIAKVTRDKIMNDYAQLYPLFKFDKHKGYGTAEHIAALQKYGPTVIHRASFIKNFVSAPTSCKQESLFS